MDTPSRDPVDQRPRSRQTYETPPSSYRPNRMSLDASRQPYAGSPRHDRSSASPSVHRNETDDFRTRLNRLSLQSSSSASPLSRSSSLRCRPGGGVADVGLGRRSTILNGSMRSEQNGMDHQRESTPSRRDSPYRPSTSYSRYSESNSLHNTMNGQHGSPNEKRYLRASPEGSRSYRSTAQSSLDGISPARTPTPTASAALDNRISTTSRRTAGHNDRRSGRYVTDELLSVGSGYRSSRDLSDGSSAGRSVSNSTVRDFGNQDDVTLKYRQETSRRARVDLVERSYRTASPVEAKDHIFARSEIRSDHSYTPASARSTARRSVSEQPESEDEMPAEEKVDMWMRSGSARQGSGEESSTKRRNALPAEFRNDMHTPTRSSAADRHQSRYEAPSLHRQRDVGSPSMGASVSGRSDALARLSTNDPAVRRDLRSSTSPSGSMVSGSSRLTGTQGSPFSETPERSRPQSTISSSSIAGDDDLAESRRRRKELLQSSSRQIPSGSTMHTPARSSTISSIRGIDSHLISSEPRAASRASRQMRPSTSMSQLRDIGEPRTAPSHLRLNRQSMIYLPAPRENGVDGLPDSPLARYQRTSDPAAQVIREDGPFTTSRSSIFSASHIAPRASSPTRSIMSTATSTRPSNRGTPSRVAMTRLQAKLRKSSDRRSKIMLEACIKLLTSIGGREAAGNDRTEFAKIAQLVATTAEDLHLRSDAALHKINSLIDQCLEVDPENDDDDEGEAAIVLVNVQGGLEEAKAMLIQLSTGGTELVGFLASLFDGLHGHQYGAQAESPFVYGHLPAKNDGRQDETAARHETSPIAAEVMDRPEEVNTYVETTVNKPKKPIFPLQIDATPRQESVEVFKQPQEEEPEEDIDDIAITTPSQVPAPENIEIDEPAPIESIQDDVISREEKNEDSIDNSLSAAEPSNKRNETSLGQDQEDESDQPQAFNNISGEEEEVQIPFPNAAPDAHAEDFEVELPPITPSSPAQPSSTRYSRRSRKSSSSASILSIRARPGGDTMFKPGTPTTAVSTVIAQSAAGVRDSPGATPGSPLTEGAESNQEADYFTKHRKESFGSVESDPREEEMDEVEVRSDKDALLVRPAYGTASQSLREIHQAK